MQQKNEDCPRRSQLAMSGWYKKWETGNGCSEFPLEIPYTGPETRPEILVYAFECAWFTPAPLRSPCLKSFYGNSVIVVSQGSSLSGPYRFGRLEVLPLTWGMLTVELVPEVSCPLLWEKCFWHLVAQTRHWYVRSPFSPRRRLIILCLRWLPPTNHLEAKLTRVEVLLWMI